MKHKNEESEYQLELLSTFLKDMRLAYGKSQLELANDIGLHRNTMYRIENQKNFTILTLL